MQIEELFEESELSSETARFIIEGSAYYDIEDDSGKWLRILCEYGDLLILPAGRLHRFTTTPKVTAFLFLLVPKPVIQCKCSHQKPKIRFF
ncbi:unnamed protein product [Gongylonema pulchrum]|uniref:Cupin_2 domain-containing protein n=1 Tax=Gongylonema pulchrum TaxID=637853 RepID=A0A183DF85_9BILA|nr:unnamed protein product [Gongylonema pulchrum]